MKGMLRFVVQAPRWLFLGALVYAPWAYGSTRPWAINVLLVQLSLVLVLWLAGCALRRTWPVIPRVPVAFSCFLILQAWWMVLNAKYDEFFRVTLSEVLTWAPGSVHRAASLEIALRISILLLAGLFVCDLVRGPHWRKRVLLTVALTGVSIAALGILQRVTHAPGMFWGEPVEGGTFFASYRYHANAGSFLNLAWPLVAALFVIASHRAAPFGRFWGAALALGLAAMFVNSSRAAAVITMVLGMVWLAWLIRQYIKGRLRLAVNPAGVAAIGLGIILLLSVAYMFGGLDLSWKRWGELSGHLSKDNPRLLVAGVCWRLIPDAGVFGFGPGTFEAIFPYYTRDLGDAISGIWYFAHQDYLQAILEWGWLGAAAWAALIFGAVIFAWRAKKRDSAQWSTSDRVYYFAILTALLGVLLHAWVDFPLQIASIQLYVAVLVGMLWGSGDWCKAESKSKNVSEEPIYAHLAWNHLPGVL